MSRTTKSTARATLPLVRCAIYTRKSTEEGLEQEFNSLDAQRESAEAFVTSQQHEGWRALEERYDDGGFSGGDTERPALQRLMRDIEAGKIDCVVVYKVDRLSRSLMDFAQMMQTFANHKVSFVSVTQQFNTGNSMGRLILNVLLSFAQFEREIISERTRDKIAATRRKGKWSGGRPILGYDLDRERRKLVVNEDEAIQVRAIFDLYLQHEALLPVVQELERREWVGKRWINRKGEESGGQPFEKTSLHRLLTNVIFLGKVKYKDEVHDGEHPAIVDPVVWDKVQKTLQRNARMGGAPTRNQFGALLKGLLRCSSCNCSMTPSHTTRKNKRYRYYVCSNAQKRGWDHCPAKSIPAGEIEQFVVDQIRIIGTDPVLLQQTLVEAHAQDEKRLEELESEQRQLHRDQKNWQLEIQKLSGQFDTNGSNDLIIARLADLHERSTNVELRNMKIREQIQKIHTERIHEDEARTALSLFDPLWQQLTPKEQARVIHLLIDQISYDGKVGKVSITFHPTGIKTLAEELSIQNEEMIA